MDRDTVGVYAALAREWRDRRPARFTARATALGGAVASGGVVADLGAGTGAYLPFLPRPTVAFDAAVEMLRLARDAEPDSWPVCGDLEALPFRRGALAGAWARASYLHVPVTALPLALGDLHRALAVGAPVTLVMSRGDGEGTVPDDDFPGRRFSFWQPGPLRDVVVGAGFDVAECAVDEATPDWVTVTAVRARTLPDFVAPGMRLLVCGLNPSLYAADAGVGFARPGNRFWPAALAAGLVTRARDPRHALDRHGVGMTDLVKRATVGAAELERDEYREGLERVRRLVAWLQPGAVCFVGLAGWRAVVDRRASPGVQPERLAGRPVYVMPNTSGLNAHVGVPELAAHLRAAAELSS